MKKILVTVFIFLLLLIVSCEEKETAQTTIAQEINDENAPALAHVTTHTLGAGTHRPEIFTNEDTLYLFVVEHEGNTRHKGYIFDAADPTSLDFENPEAEFMVTEKTEEYGAGADHRAAIVGNEIWVVYQTLIFRDDAPLAKSGASEPYAESQSLMFARFSLAGEELARENILTSTNFDEDTFPDMSILAFNEHLLVSTGTEQRSMKIREVDKDATILNEYIFTSSETTIPGRIGNSMLFDPEGTLLFLSYTMGKNQEDHELTISSLDPAFTVTSLVKFPVQGREQAFPTGPLYHDGYYYIGYITRNVGGENSPEQNPYHPALKILNSDFNIVYDTQISEEDGNGHVHPTLAILGDRLFYAWSKKTTSGPQVMIEEFVVE